MSVLMSLMLVISGAIQTQTDWVSGPGTLGPVPSWGSAFYQSTDINYNITGQISLVGTSTPAGTWQKHIINTDEYISGHAGLFPADFDGDGDMDLAGAVRQRGIRIFRNNLVESGTKTFTEQTTLTALPVPQHCLIWCGDLDLDGDADIVVPSHEADGWYENVGGFSFTYHQIGTHAYDDAGGSCDVGDVDNDGDQDVVTCPSRSYALTLWRNDGSMSFAPEICAAGENWRVKLGDLNNDGYLDLLNASDVRLYDPLAGSYPTAPSWTMGLWGVDGIWIRDFDNDGYKDLLICDQWTRFTYWMENDGTGAGYALHVVFPDPHLQYGDACVAEDIDLDGKTDVVAGCYQVGFFKQIDMDNFQENKFDNIYPRSCHWVYAANLDYEPSGSDFDLDILVTYGGSFVWYENPSQVTYATSGTLESSIFDAASPAAWEALLWNGNRPSTTTLSLYVRTGTDATAIQEKTWQGPFDIPVGQASGELDISSFTTSGEHLFQYKVAMGGDGSESPVIYDLGVRFGVLTVAVVSVDVPGVPEPVGFTWYPQATLQNYGGTKVTFDVTITDGLGYTSTYADLTLGPAGEGSDVQQITFPDQWTAGAAGTYTFTAGIHADGNTATGQIEVVKSDKPDPWCGSMLTQGYWKNHPYYDPQHPDDPYVEEYLPVEVAGEEVNTVDDALAVFDPPEPVTAWKMFLIQFLAAKLNAGWQNNPSLLAAWYNCRGRDRPFDNQRVFDIFQVADGYRSTTDTTTLHEMKTVLDNMNNYTDGHTRCLWDAPFPPGPGPQGVEVAARRPKLDLSVAPSLVKSGIVRIAYSLPKAAPAQLQVLDITGRTVMTQSLPAVGDNVVTLDASSWGAGVYILKLKGDACNLTRKVVIE